jgi:hypothetical protein
MKNKFKLIFIDFTKILLRAIKNLIVFLNIIIEAYTMENGKIEKTYGA